MARSGRKRARKPEPGRDQNVEEREVTIADPYEPMKALAVKKNTRVHPLDYEHANGRITDTQKIAGDRFLALWDRAALGGAKAIDYSAVKVDVSHVYRGLSDAQMRAGQGLKEAHAAVGPADYALLVAAIGERQSMRNLAAMRDGCSPPSWRTIQDIREAFRSALSKLARHLRVEATGQEGGVRVWIGTENLAKAVESQDGKIDLDGP